MSTLQDLLTRTQRLLHDANFKYWTQQTLTDAINSAQRRVVGDSLCNRSLQQIYLTGGLETYSYGSVTGVQITAGGSGYTTASVQFSPPPYLGALTVVGTIATGVVTLSGGAVTAVTVTNPGSGYTENPTVTIIGNGVSAAVKSTALNASTMDTLNITVLWGSERVILNRMSFTQLQATVRSWMGYSQRPCYCANYGQNGWYIGPVPDQYYQSEWDTILIPPNLVAAADVSVVQYPFDECIPYYAAHTAKYQEQSYAEAEKFLEIYTRKMQYSRRSVMMRMIPSAYN